MRGCSAEFPNRRIILQKKSKQMGYFEIYSKYKIDTKYIIKKHYNENKNKIKGQNFYLKSLFREV